MAMPLFLEQVKKTINKYCLLDPGDRVIVAVSGGPDSVCLLAALHALSLELNITLHVAHLDHMVRGQESADEAEFVRRIAGMFSVPSTIEKIDVPLYCRERGLSLQAGAREVRYEFLQTVLSAQGARRIATGHTADDQAETLLLRLIRGAGVSALSGIPPVRGAVIRPLIEISRDEIMAYLHSNKLDHVSDPSNAKPVYTRNRIRLELMPVLKQFNPRIVQVLAAEAGLLRDENDAAEASLQSLSGDIIEKREDSVVLKREAFNRLPLAFRRRLVKQVIARHGILPETFSSVRIDEAITFMATAQTGRSMQLVPGSMLEREYDHLIVRQETGPLHYSQLLAVPGITSMPDLGLEVEIRLQDIKEQQAQVGNGPETGPFPSPIYFWQALFDYDKMHGPVKLRNRLPGDRFCPLGMAGKSKKIQDLFVDSKIPQRRRETLPLLAAGDDIIWVVGLRTDERYRITADTSTVMSVQIRDASDK